MKSATVHIRQKLGFVTLCGKTENRVRAVSRASADQANCLICLRYHADSKEPA